MEKPLVLSPLIISFGVLLNCDHIAAWWDRKHIERKPGESGR